MIKKLSTFLIVYLVFCHISFAWEGINIKNNSLVEIGSGNLVREGLIIEFYEDGELHTGRIVTMNETSGGTELVIEDLSKENKEKTLVMY